MTHLTRRPNRLGTWLVDRATRTDLILAAVLVALFLVWSLPTDANARAATLPVDTRSALYMSAAAIAGGLLGFVITALSVLLALPSGRRLGFLTRSKAWPQLPSVFIRTAWTLAAATFIFAASIAVDDGTTPCTAMEAVAIAAAASLTLRVSASILLLGRLVQYSVEDRVAENAIDDDAA